MGLPHRIATTLRSWFKSRQVDTDLEEELRFHLEREVRANIDAGMSPADARRAAAMAVGDSEVIKELSRLDRPGRLLRQALRDAVFGARLLLKAPGFALAAVTIVALGIAATTTVFSVMYGIVFRPLPYPEASRLVGVWTHDPRSGFPRLMANAADYTAWRESNHVFEDIAIVRNIANFNLTGDGPPERVIGARMSANLLSVLRVHPALGRGFIPVENEIGHDNVVILSDGLWRRRFNADPGVLGRTLPLSGAPHTIVGVMPQGFDYPGPEFQLWVPATIDPAELARTVPGYSFLAVARLKTGIGIESARRDMNAIATRLAAETPATNRDITFEVLPLLEETVGVVRPALYGVFGAAACLLLISCLNLANLFGARSAARTREYAVRLALGATRSRLMLQACAEALPVLAMGGAGGLAGAWAGIRVFATMAPAALPRIDAVVLDAPVLAFALIAVSATGLIATIRPALRASQATPGLALREGGRSSAGGASQSRVSNGLVVAQIALVLPLLVVTALLARSFANVVQIEPGFRTDHLLSMQLAISRSTYASDQRVADFCRRLLDRVATVPGVESAGMVNRLPLGGVAQTLAFTFDGLNLAQPVMVDSRSITPGYFATMGIPLLSGRDFTDQDTGVLPIPGIGAMFPTTAVVDERIVRDLFPGQSVLGRRFRLPFPGAPAVEIVGVVGHIRHDGLEVDPRPQIYFSYRQRPQDRMALVVRGSGDPRALEAPIRAALQEVDASQPLYDVRTMDEVMSRSTATRRMGLTLIAVFASCAVVLAGIGLYGIVAFGVTQRTREFGVRMAMGGRPSDIAGLVIARATRLAVAGSALGLLLSLAAARAAGVLLFGVGAFDAVSFLSAAAALAVVTLAATYLPARRASSVDPAVTLRAE